MERCLILLIIKKYMNQNHNEIPLHTIRMTSTEKKTKKKKQKRTSVSNRIEELETLYISSRMKNGAAAVESSMVGPKQIKPGNYPAGPAVPLLDKYLETWTNTCTPVFTATLVTVAQRWK